uniref:SCAN box domain-containing protein n=1 Tax=Myotis myotis TaxID=51298 RepID=A0A7J7VI65_MYOMY|nr:hypothetical protein mMyoMyo1_008285 [Myotis myotis]
MASQDEPAGNGPRGGNLPLRFHGRPANQEGEEVEVGVPSPGLISLNNSGHPMAELQAIYWSLCAWLQPHRRTKLEMIFQLSVEQFLRSRPSSERAAWRQKWESSGRNMEAFMEHLMVECPRPPRMVRVRMGGQEGLFPQHMLLGQIRAYLQAQRSAAASMALALGTPSQTPPETPRPVAPGDADEDAQKLYLCWDEAHNPGNVP